MAEQAKPRHYFLNESLQLSPGSPAGGGRFKPFVVSWRDHGQRLASGFTAVLASAKQRKDPSGDRRVFMVAAPEQSVRQKSDAAEAVDGLVERPADFAGDGAAIFIKLGLGLLAVGDDGAAIVQASRPQLESLAATSLLLDELSEKERAPWARIGQFLPVARHRKVDQKFLAALDAAPAEAVLRAHHVLDALEAARLEHALAERIRAAGRAILASGRDTVGSLWIRFVATRALLEGLADQFDSIRWICPPTQSRFAATAAHSPPMPALQAVPGPGSAAAAALPVVAIVDSGVVEGHLHLAHWLDTNVVGPAVRGPHGTAVASRAVFGDLPDWPSEGPEPPAACRVVDVRVGEALPNGDVVVTDEEVIRRMATVVDAGMARIFNLSIGDDDKSGGESISPRQLEDRLHKTFELDHFAFATDSVVIVSAGNSIAQLSPSVPYPKHFLDPRWRLTHWAAGANTLVVGATVRDPHPDAVGQPGDPSNFSRVGPGLANACQPLFAASGGSWTSAYMAKAELGVAVAGVTGWQWQRMAGTSLAAPIVAREAANALRFLTNHLPHGTRVTAGLVKALLVAAARAPRVTTKTKQLVSKALGYGRPDVPALECPSIKRALLCWQGVVPSSKTLLRIRLPIPRDWATTAGRPMLRVIAAWNSPITEAATQVWTSREVTIAVRHGIEKPTIARPSAKRLGALPVIDRTYALEALREDTGTDEVVVEVGYQQRLPSTLRPPDEQPVGIVFELRDHEDNVPPHDAIQAWAARIGVDLEVMTPIERPIAVGA